MISRIVIRDVNIHNHTGHISVLVQTENEDGNATWCGPARTYGCDAASYLGRFQGDVEQLKLWIISEHQQYMGAHTDISEKLAALKGQTIG